MAILLAFNVAYLGSISDTPFVPLSPPGVSLSAEPGVSFKHSKVWPKNNKVKEHNLVPRQDLLEHKI